MAPSMIVVFMTKTRGDISLIDLRKIILGYGDRLVRYNL